MTDKQKRMPFWMIPAVLMLLCSLFLAALPRFLPAPGCPGHLALTEAPPHVDMHYHDSRSTLTIGVPLIKE